MTTFQESWTNNLDASFSNDDFFMEITVDRTSSEIDFDLDDDEDFEMGCAEELPSFYLQQRQMAARSPSPSYSYSYANQVTPDNSHHEKTMPLPDLGELQEQYNRTLKSLAKSMRRSDATRSVIKQQSRMLPTATYSFNSNDGSTQSTDFFSSNKCRELEETRRQLFQVISHR